MRLRNVGVDNFRAIGHLELPLDPSLTVLHGDNANGKTSVLGAIAVGLGAIATLLPDVSGVGFKDIDRRRGTRYTRVQLTSTDGVSWDRVIGLRPRILPNRFYRLVHLKEYMDQFTGEMTSTSQSLPIIAFYDTDRAVFELPHRRRNFKKEFTRFGALEGALSAKTTFRSVFEWFYAKQHEELLDQRHRRDFEYCLSDLNAVRRAICSMIPGASNPHIELSPLRFVVSLRTEGGREEKLSLSEMSGGYRIMLALVADLARRMAQGNPHLDDPLQAEAIVLIDEVDLHLHPSWQQRVLGDLMRTFPNTQFIVSTHSPQVLSTVEPHRIVRLSRQNGDIVAGPATSATYGAEAGHVLQTEMGVSERPKNEFSDKLAEYFNLIDRDAHGSERALDLRRRLEELSPRDTALDRADGEIRRREVLKSLGRKP